MKNFTQRTQQSLRAANPLRSQREIKKLNRIVAVQESTFAKASVDKCDPSASTSLASGKTATQLLNDEMKVERSVARDDDKNYKGWLHNYLRLFIKNQENLVVSRSSFLLLKISPLPCFDKFHPCGGVKNILWGKSSSIVSFCRNIFHLYGWMLHGHQQAYFASMLFVLQLMYFFLQVS